jgi:hypothetical protein
MKKLLILLLLSLTYIGSANANSIEGAFGYKLGDVYKSSSVTLSHKFLPRKPFPGLDEYQILTGVDDRIVKISAKKIKWESSGYYCSDSNFTGFRKLLKLLQAKYGQFEKIIDERKEYADGTSEQAEYKYEDGGRNINLYCDTSYVNGTGSYRLFLTYIDTELQSLLAKDLSESLKNSDSEMMLDL